MDSKDFENMDFSCDNFCSLDLLAEVASATLQSDPSLFPKLPQKTTPKKVSTWSRRKLNKYVDTYEKFTLDQVKSLSEKNLLELFSEQICDEMKKTYSFQCFLIPDKCSQVYQSFGNEAKARFLIKSHLLSHLRELSAAAEASDNQEEFTAVPLRSRNNLLKETSCKDIQKRNKGKQSSNKAKKGFAGYYHKSLSGFLPSSTETNINNAALTNDVMKTEHGEFDRFGSLSENVMRSFNEDSKRVKKTTYFPIGPICSSETTSKAVQKKSEGKESPIKAEKNLVSCFNTRSEDFLPFSTESNIKNAAISEKTIKTENEDFDDGNSDDFEILKSSSENVVKSCNDDKKKVKKITYYPIGPFFNSEFNQHNSSRRVVVKFHGDQLGDHENSSFKRSISPVKKKQKSKRQSRSKVKTCDDVFPNLSQFSSSDYIERNTSSKCDNQSQSKNFLQVHHDHTYTSVNGKTLICDYSAMGEGSKSSKMCKDYFHSKKAHHCVKKESPLIIPTPLYPIVFDPVLPHIASMEEVGSNVDSKCCKCFDAVNRSIIECDYKPQHVPHSLPNQPESHMSSASECTDNVHFVHLLSENSSNSSAKDNPSEFNESIAAVADHSRDPFEVVECPERENSEEQDKALKCIRIVRTLTKDDSGFLKCQISQTSFTAQATLLHHYKSHAGVKPLTCSVCEATFADQNSMNFHLLIHRNQSRFVCVTCGRSFPHPSDFKDHLRRLLGKTSTGDIVYECPECDPQ